MGTTSMQKDVAGLAVSPVSPHSCCQGPWTNVCSGDRRQSEFPLPRPLHCPQEMQHSALCRQQQRGGQPVPTQSGDLQFESVVEATAFSDPQQSAC
ncbi:unnamed protein product [Lota lota]